MAVGVDEARDIETAPPATWLHRVVSQRVVGRPAWVVVAELFLGLGWLRAAAEKVIDPAWWRGELLGDFVTAQTDLALGWYRPFLDLVAGSRAAENAMVVLVLQAVVGLTLLAGRGIPMALAVGVFLNLHFVAAGAVNPSAFYLVIEGVLALWLAERSTRHLEAGLRVVATTMVALALMSVPFINTVQPAAVVHDPALMYVTLGGLTLLGCDLVHRTVTRGHGLP